MTSAAITPLRVEEHTAQISSLKRLAIERDFKSSSDDSIDVVCGSTTFELGVDLGSIHSVFMARYRLEPPTTDKGPVERGEDQEPSHLF